MTKSQSSQVDETRPTDVVANSPHRIQCAHAISLVDFDVMNRLTSMPGRHIGFRGLNGGTGTGCERGMRVLLDVGGVRTTVYLAGRGESEQHGWYAFDDISPAQRAELWALRGWRLKHAFERAVTVTVSIIEVAAGTVPSGWPRLALRLGRIEIGCWVDSAAAAQAVVSARKRRMPVLPTLSFLPVKCQFRLRAMRLSHDEFRGLADGDVLVLTPHATEPLRGKLSAPGLGYCYPMTYTKDGTVTIEQREITLEPDDPHVELEARKIELIVELATCQMTLGELANLQAGQTLRLAKPAREMTVDIRYRGACVARGSLVEIAGLLGIHIDTIRSEASE